MAVPWCATAQQEGQQQFRAPRPDQPQEPRPYRDDAQRRIPLSMVVIIMVAPHRWGVMVVMSVAVVAGPGE